VPEHLERDARIARSNGQREGGAGSEAKDASPLVSRAPSEVVPFGLVETVRCEDGGAPLLPFHQARLEQSWPSFFGSRAPELATVAASAIAATHGGSALVRVAFVGARGGRATASVDARALAPRPRAVDVALAASPRLEPPDTRRHKCADRRFAAELAVADVFETLLWDDVHGLLEGVRTNLFVWVGDELWTPPVDHGLVPGVVRRALIETAPRAGLVARERSIGPADLQRGRGLLLTGSGVGVVAVRTCDGRAVGSAAATALARRLEKSALAAR
jgi:branched-subunit amino acid aminotransferase/4-amino-4-deoxychorismate lyase